MRGLVQSIPATDASSGRIGCAVAIGCEKAHAPAVGEAQIVLGEDFVDGAAGDAAHVEQRDPVEVFGHGLQVVVDDDDGLARRTQFLEQLDDGAFGGGVHALEGFVHEVDVGVLDERAGQEGALLLAAGKLADLAVGVVLHADLVQGVQGEIGVLFARSANPAEGAVAAHRDHVEDAGGEVPVDAAALGDVADAPALLLVGLAVDLHLTGSDRRRGRGLL